MNKKTLFLISIAVNIILALVLVIVGTGAVGQLQFNYVEEDTIRPDSLRSYLDRENYGVAASLSHPIRGGAEVDPEDLDYYRLGEYADLLFLKEIFKEAGNDATVENFEQKLSKIREEMPEYGILFDKIEESAKNALPK